VDSIKTLHVKQLTGEDGSTKRLIADKLKSKGFTVTAEPDQVLQPMRSSPTLIDGCGI